VDFEPKAPDGDAFEPAAQTRGPVALDQVAPAKIDPHDWHLPSLGEVFGLAKAYPGKRIFLDSKTAGRPEVATRLAQQYVDLLRQYPYMRDRVIVANPDPACLDAMKQVFASQPDFKDFKNFSLDDEHLNDKGSHSNQSIGNPLRGSGDNSFISLGDPATPLVPDRANFDDVLKQTKQALSHTRDPKDPAFGKKLFVWTIDDPAKMDALAKLGPDGILTDNPQQLNQILDNYYGPAGQDPQRPEVMCHRGGPDNEQFPENTLPMIQKGFELGDSIEIDLCPAQDGCIVFHDDNPNDTVALARDAELENTSFRPLRPDLGSKLRGKRLDQLTMAEIRSNYGFERKSTHDVAANVGEAAVRNVIRGPGALLEAVGTGLGQDSVATVGATLNKVIDKTVEPGLGEVTKGVDKLGRTIEGLFHHPKK
jgi:glycerophosphoryl diester phosphodiesterase